MLSSSWSSSSKPPALANYLSPQRRRTGVPSSPSWLLPSPPSRSHVAACHSQFPATHQTGTTTGSTTRQNFLRRLLHSASSSPVLAGAGADAIIGDTPAPAAPPSPTPKTKKKKDPASGNAASGNTVSGDRRIAGRPRFYKSVGVTAYPESPHWGVDGGGRKKGATADTAETAEEEEKEPKALESPISAGVDGTQSASGVRHIPNRGDSNGDSGDTSLQSMLTPRRPGEESSSANDDAGTTTTTNTNNNTRWYGVTLDGRALSTPMGQKLAVPSETLAHMIAAEWDAQTTLLRPTDMPLMTLACTALDQAAYHPHLYRDEAVRYLPTDTVRCPVPCRAAPFVSYRFISFYAAARAGWLVLMPVAGPRTVPRFFFSSHTKLLCVSPPPT